MPKPRDPEWLADVRAPGPNGQRFEHLLEVRLGATNYLYMQDDVNTSLFVPGANAYAGYYNGSYANMTAVRAFAAAHGARSFSYTPNGNSGADAIDIEPGDAVPATTRLLPR